MSVYLSISQYVSEIQSGVNFIKVGCKAQIIEMGSIHLRFTPTPNFLRRFLLAQKFGTRAQSAKKVHEIDPWVKASNLIIHTITCLDSYIIIFSTLIQNNSDNMFSFSLKSTLKDGKTLHKIVRKRYKFKIKLHVDIIRWMVVVEDWKQKNKIKQKTLKQERATFL